MLPGYLAQQKSPGTAVPGLIWLQVCSVLRPELRANARWILGQEVARPAIGVIRIRDRGRRWSARTHASAVSCTWHRRDAAVALAAGMTASWCLGGNLCNSAAMRAAAGSATMAHPGGVRPTARVAATTTTAAAATTTAAVAPAAGIAAVIAAARGTFVAAGPRLTAEHLFKTAAAGAACDRHGGHHCQHQTLHGSKIPFFGADSGSPTRRSHPSSYHSSVPPVFVPIGFCQRGPKRPDQASSTRARTPVNESPSKPLSASQPVELRDSSPLAPPELTL